MKQPRSHYRHIVKQSDLPELYPTHAHSGKFWEALGRTVATFGFLEQTLGKATFALTATRDYSDDEMPAAFEKWQRQLPSMLSDPLGALITKYETALREHSEQTFEGIDDLIAHLIEAKAIRNVLCHGSWNMPDDQERSVPFFMNKVGLIFDTPVDVEFLVQTRQHVVELACEVINSITSKGWQFPSSGGPGFVIL